MGSFARLAANALSEFIGGADDVATKGSDDLVSTSVKADKKAITKTSSTPSWFKETEVNTNIKAEDSAKTQITTTTATYEKALAMLPKGKTLDYGAGKGVGAKKLKRIHMNLFQTQILNLILQIQQLLNLNLTII